MNTRLKHIAVIMLAIILAGCAAQHQWFSDNREQISATATIVAKRAAIIASRVVLSAAVSHYDKERKVDFLDGLANGFRSLEVGEVITASDVESMVKTWTPDKSHWDELAERFAAEWERIQPKTAKESAQFAEAFAQGLNMVRDEKGMLIVTLEVK